MLTLNPMGRQRLTQWLQATRKSPDDHADQELARRAEEQANALPLADDEYVLVILPPNATRGGRPEELRLARGCFSRVNSVSLQNPASPR